MTSCLAIVTILHTYITNFYALYPCYNACRAITTSDALATYMMKNISIVIFSLHDMIL